MFRGFYDYDTTERIWRWIVRGYDNMEMDSGTCKHKREMKETMERMYFVEWSQPVY